MGLRSYCLGKEEDEVGWQTRCQPPSYLANDLSTKADIGQKYGRPNEATPAKWNAEYKDFNAPLGDDTSEPAKQIPSGDTAAGAIKSEAGTTEAAIPTSASAIPPSTDKGESKKRKRHEGESAEEKAERKRKKKEKKEKLKSVGDGG